MTTPLQESGVVSLIVSDAMVERAARALAPHVAGVYPQDRWTLDAVRDVLRAALESDGGVAER